MSTAPGRSRVAPVPGGDRRPTLREEQRLLTRTRLVEAGIALFAEKGYVATTVEDIAASARTSRATFYLHFESKLALLGFVGAQHETWAPATLNLMDGVGAIPRERVEAMVREGFRHWREHASLIGAFLQAEAVEVGLRERTLPHLHEVVEAAFPLYLGQFAGAERDLARTEMVMLVLLTYRYMFYEFTSRPFPDDLDLQVRAMTDLVWRVVTARATSPGPPPAP
jgi:AcrR family transcriptional regulator